MLVGTVVGNVWATKKDATLEGLRFLVVQPLNTSGPQSAETLADLADVGAGLEQVGRKRVPKRVCRQPTGPGRDLEATSHRALDGPRPKCGGRARLHDRVRRA